MSEYIKKVDLLGKAVEVEYLGRPRLMVSVARIGETPSIDIVRCKECVYSYEVDTDFGALRFCKKYQYHFNADGFCSYGERRE